MKRVTAALLVLGLLGSCGDEELTQVMIVVDTDFDVPEELNELDIAIFAPGGSSPYGYEDAIGPGDLPIHLAVVHRSGPLGTYTVRVTGKNSRLESPDVIQRRAEFSFVRGEVLELRMDLLRSCLAVVCASDESCGPKGCEPRLVTDLPPYEGATRFDGGMPDMDPPMDMEPDGCVATEESCDGVDQDCDGVADNGFDLMTDMQNCGACGRACNADPAMGSESCVGGECVLICDADFEDCDQMRSSGCESDLTSAATCGSCEVTCSGPTPVCDVDVCISECPGGTTDCDGTCANLASSTAHCGSCGNACSGATNASAICTEVGCDLRCDPGFFDCDTLASTGCESRLADLSNCGACGATCEGARAMTSCLTGSCEIIQCDMGYRNCDGGVMNGCEIDIRADLANCGDCGVTCPANPANGAPFCTAGRCGVQCDAGYGDCNGNPDDGCETFFGSTNSCGSCGIICDGDTPVCAGSGGVFSCTASCEPGQTACGSTCVDLTSDVRNCGGCDVACADPMNASPTCSSSACGITCDAGFRSCDADPANGCETNITTVSDCGMCGRTCSAVANANIGCSSGGCVITGCIGTARNCDTTYGNGCEVDVATDPNNCGSCGRVCSPGPHVSAVGCAALACTITGCEAGWADCDGDFMTGCEANLTSRKTCGSCTNDCGGGPNARCCDGVCGC